MDRKFKVTNICLVLLLAWYLYIPIPAGFSSPWKFRLVSAIEKVVMDITWSLGVTEVYPMYKTVRFLGEVAHRADNEIPDSIVAIKSEFDGVPVRIYRPKEELNTGHRSLVYYHGGGWLVGDTHMYEILMLDIAKNTDGIVIISVEYRRSPEFKFPIPFEDCVKATKYFISNAEEFGADPDRVAIGGDSAGGNLAAVVSMKLRDDNFTPMPRTQILVYPMLQMVDFFLAFLSTKHSASNV